MRPLGGGARLGLVDPPVLRALVGAAEAAVGDAVVVGRALAGAAEGRAVREGVLRNRRQRRAGRVVVQGVRK
eukprot:gene17179-biopygen3790